MKVFTDEFLTIDYYSDQNYFLVTRKGEQNIDFETYKYIIDHWLNTVKKYKPQKQLVDYSELLVPISPEHQKYAQENLIIPAVKISIKKTAFIISRDLFAQMSVEETMARKAGDLEFRYFSDFNKAKEWLLNE